MTFDVIGMELWIYMELLHGTFWIYKQIKSYNMKDIFFSDFRTFDVVAYKIDSKMES